MHAEVRKQTIENTKFMILLGGFLWFNTTTAVGRGQPARDAPYRPRTQTCCKSCGSSNPLQRHLLPSPATAWDLRAVFRPPDGWVICVIPCTVKSHCSETPRNACLGRARGGRQVQAGSFPASLARTFDLSDS